MIDKIIRIVYNLVRQLKVKNYVLQLQCDY